MQPARRVLLLCTHNSVRSQMAEGLLRAHYGERYEIASAGTRPAGVNPLAVRVMAEVGIDIPTSQVSDPRASRSSWAGPWTWW